MMNGLTKDLEHEILARMNLESLAKMRCTDKYFRSHISDNPQLKSEFYSRVPSSLLHVSTEGSTTIYYISSLDSTSVRVTEFLELSSRILGSSSGLLLLFNTHLCVTNPLTKKFQFIDHSRSKLFPAASDTTSIGFVVDQTDGSTLDLTYKIVCIKESPVRRGSNEIKYEFEVKAGRSWMLSKTTIITIHTSSLDKKKRPVYVNGTLHWLRYDGSIIAFDPETDKARLIPSKFPQEPRVKALFAAAGKEVTLILPTEEVLYVYALEDNLTDPKWVLVREIGNEVVVKNSPMYWDVVAYDGKCLMLRETKDDGYLVHRYDVGANKWAVMGSIPDWCDASRDFLLFEPWFSSVRGLSEKREKKKIKSNDVERISSLSSIMGLIAGVSSEKIQMELRKRSFIEETVSTSKKQRN